MKLALAALALLVCALALYFAKSARDPGVEIDAKQLSSLARRADPLEPLDTRDERRSVAPGALPAAASSPTAPVAGAAFDVRVVVLSRGERLPLEGLIVQLAWWQAESTVPKAQGVTDASGAVNLRLESGGEAREPLCTITVGAGDRARRFGALPLQSELVVLMDACTRLHGRIVISDSRLTTQAWVQIEEPARGMMSCDVMLGRSRVQDDGSFEVVACPSREIPWVGVRVMIASVAVLRRLSWAELASEAGALIEIRLGELTLRVVDENGTPLAGADVRVAPLGDDAPFPAVGTSDARGEFRTTLEDGEFEIVAGCKGRACTSERIRFDAKEGPRAVELRLRSLSDGDRLRGRVVRENGAAVEGALVTASPATESKEGAMAGFVQVRTGADGKFALAIAAEGELRAVAFHRDLGMSDELRFRPDGRELVLVIRSQGSLEVNVAVPRGISGFAGGLVDYVLVDRHFECLDHGHEPQVPFSLYEIPAGDYMIFVHVPGWDAYAEGNVTVVPSGKQMDEPTKVELPSRTAQFARGHVRLADGSPATGAVLVLEHPTWPGEVEKLWSTKVGDDGRFEAFLGEETTCAARISLGGKLVTVQLHAGDGAELAIP